MLIRRIPAALTLLLAGLTSSPALAQSLAGSSYATLSRHGLSTLGVDLGALEMEVCQLAEPPTGRGAVLVITNDGGGHLANLQVTVLSTAQADPPRTLQVWVQPTLFSAQGAELLAFECGTFSYHLVLNPAAAQPISALTLTPNNAAGTQGMANGYLALHILIILEPVAGGSTFEQPRTISLWVNGRYRMLSREVLGAGDSPLQLFASGEDNYGRPLPPSCVRDYHANTCLLLEPMSRPADPAL